jgi:hypothetical protein
VNGKKNDTEIHFERRLFANGPDIIHVSEHVPDICILIHSVIHMQLFLQKTANRKCAQAVMLKVFLPSEVLIHSVIHVYLFV